MTAVEPGSTACRIELMLHLHRPLSSCVSFVQRREFWSFVQNFCQSWSGLISCRFLAACQDSFFPYHSGCPLSQFQSFPVSRRSRTSLTHRSSVDRIPVKQRTDFLPLHRGRRWQAFLPGLPTPFHRASFLHLRVGAFSPPSTTGDGVASTECCTCRRPSGRLRVGARGTSPGVS